MWNSLFGSSAPAELANTATFILNGESRTVGSEISSGTSLNSYIRDVAKLSGTKYVCYEGQCGACIVAATIEHPISKQKETFAVNSCLVPVFGCHGWEITTVEGIGDRHTGYHQIQATLAQFNGTQCGFCSPGFVMNMFSLSKDKTPTMAEVEKSFGGNLCRCTGYRSILDAFKSLSSDAPLSLRNKCGTDIEDLYKICSKTGKACSGDCKTAAVPIHIKAPKAGADWYKVTSIAELFTTLNAIGDLAYKLVAGNTSDALYHSAGVAAYIDIKDVVELRTVTTSPNYVMGANVTITEAIKTFRAASTTGYLYLQQLASHMEKIANVPVANIGTLAGNLIMKKDHPEFVSDIYVAFEAIGTTLNIRDSSGNTTNVSLSNFLTADMNKKVIVNIVFPSLTDNYKLGFYKIMQRAQSSLADVSAAFVVQVQDTTSWTVTGQPRIVYGGISATFNHATNTETYLIGKNLLDAATVSGVQDSLAADIVPDYVPPAAKAEYRKPLAQALFYKFLLNLDPSKVSPDKQSGAGSLDRPLSSGVQDFQTDQSVWPVNEAIPKIEAITQCSGEAQYVDDIPLKPGELQGAFVLTKYATGTISKVDPSAALAMEGVVAFYTHSDLLGPNNFMPTDLYPFVEAEEIFCSGDVKYAGQVVGLIVAETRSLAMAGAQAVVVEYQNVTKPILSIDDVVKPLKGRMNPSKKSENVPKNPPKATHTLTGRIEIGKQHHLALETFVSVVNPTEDGYDVYASTQFMDMVQVTVARTLQIPVNNVNVHVRRLGGGFGGKQSRPCIVATACALAAHKLKRPVRIAMSLQSSLEAMGKRFAQRHEYTVNFDDNGVVESCVSHTTQDSGWSINESPLSLVFYFMNSCYNNANYTKDGVEVRTDTASNTPCRGPGPLEGIAFIEEIMERIARYLNKDPLDVKLANMIQIDNPLPAMIAELKQQANYDQRKQFLDTFNASNRWKKRGMAIIPMKYPQSIWSNYNSLVSIYHSDGTVTITHGGIEMGQGVNTKIAQIAAYKLQIPVNMIKVTPSNTITNANANVSGGSVVSEGAGLATMKACEELLRRLEPVRAGMVNPTWAQLVREAFLQRVDLAASYMFSTDDPELKSYGIWGATIAEAEVDILTGEKQILRVDLVEDVGTSLSPLIDVGQIEGAFVMGLGYWLSEEITYDPDSGRLLNKSLWNYKAPGPQDIPADFRVHFRKDSPNLTGLLGSKTTGEPAICMSVACWFAIRNAIDSARLNAGGSDTYFEMEHPATNQNIFFASLTDPSQFVF